jgi:hypothetical protein
VRNRFEGTLELTFTVALTLALLGHTLLAWPRVTRLAGLSSIQLPLTSIFRVPGNYRVAGQ